VIDEHAGQLVADRLVDQHRRDGAVDAARQAADHPPLPTCSRISAILASRNSAIVQSPASRRRGGRNWRAAAAVGRVHDLGMEHQAVEAPRLVDRDA
jgi:hypothetical protein